MKITIDGKEIAAKVGSSVLDAALAGGVFIPHLCSHPDLEARGGCRLCSVEIEGMDEAVPACMTAAADGMKIAVYGEKADRIRKMAMELILATHPAECTGCPKYGKCELQSMYQFMGVGPERWRQKSRSLTNDESNPLIGHLFTRCIRCGRCVRVCQDLRGVKVLDYIKDSSGAHAGVPEGKTLAEAGCRFCGACIEVCPTGSIVDALGVMKAEQSYADSVVPCRAACPAHVDIPRYVRFIKAGDYDNALAVTREKVPFPATLGCVCIHPCEADCKRSRLNEAVSICKLKLKATDGGRDVWKQRQQLNPPTGKQAAVIGGGPAGLTAAYYLAKQGHRVTVFEANEQAGGQCRYGIPAYRLADDVLDREIDDILAVGVKLKTASRVSDPKSLLGQGFDAVVVAIGTHDGVMLPLAGNTLKGVYVNTDFLKQSRSGTPLPVGETVMVLGGGNVAYDCARTAIRLGAKQVHIACLEEPDRMPATADEIAEGEQEGVILHAGYSFQQIIGEDRVSGVEIQKIDEFYFDENRQAVMKLVAGSSEIIPVSQVIFAVGQKPQGTGEMGLALVRNAYIAVDHQMQTSEPGIYAIGDVVTGTRSVVEAIAAGRVCAAEVDKYLGGNGDISEQLADEQQRNPYIGRSGEFAELKRQFPEIRAGAERKQDFMVYEKAFDNDAAICEAERCLQCDLRLDLTRPKLWNEY